MKISILLLFSLSIPNVYAAKVETDKQKLSYAMGVFFGQSVSRQDMDLDITAFMQAVEDILKGSELKLSRSEMQQILSDYQKKEQEQRVAQANDNKQNGIKYLEQNKKKDGVVALPNGLQYKIIKEGKGKKPAIDDTVIVHYRGTLIDGTEFDSSFSRGQPAELGVNRVIKGWQEALQLMPVGSKWQLAIPSDLAYGERGAGGVIGPNSTLLFDIELIDIK
ncbi:MAG: FKBP-type peptidyl-prolyl cis-trans isomerase [Proteobacteria bacterium]|nr:FKBP-type peptidyl-prolyl cis-trans isomerase [Pseudomonadota bacterium]